MSLKKTSLFTCVYASFLSDLFVFLAVSWRGKALWWTRQQCFCTASCWRAGNTSQKPAGWWSLRSSGPSRFSLSPTRPWLRYMHKHTRKEYTNRSQGNLWPINLQVYEKNKHFCYGSGTIVVLWYNEVYPHSYSYFHIATALLTRRLCAWSVPSGPQGCRKKTDWAEDFQQAKLCAKPCRRVC